MTDQTSGNVSLQRVAFFLIIGVLSVYILIVGKFILVPMVFAAIFMLMLQPIASFLERFVKFRVLAVSLSILFLFIFVFAVITVFSIQLVDVFRDMPAISAKLKVGIARLFELLNERWGLDQAASIKWLEEHTAKLVDTSVNFFGKGLTSGTNFLIDFFFTLIALFFLLWYRESFRNFLLLQFKKETRKKGLELLHSIQHIIRRYLYGILLVMIILAIFNSIGLWLIGIDYPVFWGCLAAVLVIIPYIGTALGGILPFIYALATTTTFWQPAAVVGYYFVIQQLEGNLITPNVVGSSVKINTFVAIVSLIIGAAVWGVPGVVLSLPFAAIIKVLLEQFKPLEPVGLLMSNRIHKDRNKFLDEWDDDEHRLKSL